MKVNGVGNQPFGGLFLNEKSTRVIAKTLADGVDSANASVGKKLINKLKDSSKADVFSCADDISVVDKINHKSYYVMGLYKKQQEGRTGYLFVNAMDKETGSVKTFQQTVSQEIYKALDSFSDSPYMQKLFGAAVIENSIPAKLAQTAVYA